MDIKKTLITFMVSALLASVLLSDLLRVKSADAAYLETLPAANALLNLSKEYDLTCLKGLRIDKNNPLVFEFLASSENEENKIKIKESLKRSINYFFAALSVSEDKIWVNLSPYEEDRVVDSDLERTELGRDLLAQDYVLKQLASSLTYPDTKLGSNYWASINAEPLRDDLSKIWISPDDARLVENSDGVFIEKATLKVESELGDDTPVSKLLVPQIRKDVNAGHNFARLRQIYCSLLLAAWYKQRLKDSIVSSLYSDKANFDDNVDSALVDGIYEKYLSSFEKGVYETVKREKSEANNVKRKYFSGGFSAQNLSSSALIVKQFDESENVMPDTNVSCTVKVNNPVASAVAFSPQENKADKALKKLLKEVNANESSLYSFLRKIRNQKKIKFDAYLELESIKQKLFSSLPEVSDEDWNDLVGVYKSSINSQLFEFEMLLFNHALNKWPQKYDKRQRVWKKTKVKEFKRLQDKLGNRVNDKAQQNSIKELISETELIASLRTEALEIRVFKKALESIEDSQTQEIILKEMALLLSSEDISVNTESGKDRLFKFFERMTRDLSSVKDDQERTSTKLVNDFVNGWKNNDAFIVRSAQEKFREDQRLRVQVARIFGKGILEHTRKATKKFLVKISVVVLGTAITIGTLSQIIKSSAEQKMLKDANAIKAKAKNGLVQIKDSSSTKLSIISTDADIDALNESLAKEFYGDKLGTAQEAELDYSNDVAKLEEDLSKLNLATQQSFEDLSKKAALKADLVTEGFDKDGLENNDWQAIEEVKDKSSFDEADKDKSESDESEFGTETFEIDQDMFKDVNIADEPQSKEEVAYAPNHRYLNTKSYRAIDPILGKYMNKKINARQIMMKGKSSDFVFQQHLTQKNGWTFLHVPPMATVKSINTEKDAGRSSVFYDKVSGAWIFKYSKKPGVIKIGVQAKSLSDSLSVPEIVDSRGNVLSRDQALAKIKDAVPSFVWDYLQSAKYQNHQVKTRVKNDILSMFYYSTNPLLDDVRKSEDSFLDYAFSNYTLLCDGFTMLDQTLSYVLEMPVLAQSGYSDVTGMFNARSAHAWIMDKNGVREPTSLAEQTSPFYNKRDVKRSDWESELDFIKERSKLAELKLKELCEQKIAKQKELNKAKTIDELVPVHVHYGKFRDVYQKKSMVVKKQIDDYRANNQADELENLILEISKLDFSTEINKYNLMSNAEFLIDLLDYLNADYQIKQNLFFKVKKTAHDNGWILKEKFTQDIHEFSYQASSNPDFINKVDQFANPLPDDSDKPITAGTLDKPKAVGEIIRWDDGTGEVDALAISIHRNGFSLANRNYIKNNKINALTNQDIFKATIYPRIIKGGKRLITYTVQGNGKPYTKTSIISVEGNEIKISDSDPIYNLTLGSNVFDASVFWDKDGEWLLGGMNGGVGSLVEKYRDLMRPGEVPRRIWVEGENEFLETVNTKTNIMSIYIGRELVADNLRHKVTQISTFAGGRKWMLASQKNSSGGIAFKGTFLPEFEDTLKKQANLSLTDLTDLNGPFSRGDYWYARVNAGTNEGRFIGNYNLPDVVRQNLTDKYTYYHLESDEFGNWSRTIKIKNNEEFFYIGDNNGHLSLPKKEIKGHFKLEGLGGQIVVSVAAGKSFYRGRPGVLNKFVGLEELLVNKKYSINALNLYEDGDWWAYVSDGGSYEYLGPYAEKTKMNGKKYDKIQESDDFRYNGVDRKRVDLLHTGNVDDARQSLYNDSDCKIYNEGIDFLERMKRQYFLYDSSAEQKMTLNEHMELIESKLRVNDSNSIAELRTWFNEFNKDRTGGEGFDIVHVKSILSDNALNLINTIDLTNLNDLSFVWDLYDFWGLSESFRAEGLNLKTHLEPELNDIYRPSDFTQDINLQQLFFLDGILRKKHGVNHAMPLLLMPEHIELDEYISLQNNELDCLKEMARLAESSELWERVLEHQKMFSDPYKAYDGEIEYTGAADVMNRLRRGMGDLDMPFDIELDEQSKSSTKYEFIKSLWQLKTKLDRNKDYERWHEINDKLNTMTFDELTGETKANTMKLLIKTIEDDLLLSSLFILFIGGLAMLALTPVDRKLYKNDKVAGHSAQQIINKIWDENGLWNGSGSMLRPLIDKIVQGEDLFDEDDLKQLEDEVVLLKGDEKFIVDLLRSVAFINPEKGNKKFRRMLGLLPGLGTIISTMPSKAFRERQKMNSDLLALMKEFSKMSEDDVNLDKLYQKLDLILSRYSQDLNGEQMGNDEGNEAEYQKLRKQFLSILSDKLKLNVAQVDRFYKKPNGYRSRRQGQGDETSGLREYQAGDSFRSINQAASARAGRKIVNTTYSSMKVDESIVVNMKTIANGASNGLWLRELVNSIKVSKKKYRAANLGADYEIRNLILLMPDGSVKVIKNPLAKIAKNEVVQAEHILKLILKSNKESSVGLSFYGTKENDSFMAFHGTGGGLSARDPVSWLAAKKSELGKIFKAANSEMFIVGFDNNERSKFAGLLASKKTFPLYWNFGEAKVALPSKKQASSNVGGIDMMKLYSHITFENKELSDKVAVKSTFHVDVTKVPKLTYEVLNFQISDN